MGVSKYDTRSSLILALQQGDQVAFEAAYAAFCKRYLGLIQSWIRTWFTQQADQDDAAQEFFLELQRTLQARIQKYERREGAAFRAWLHRVVSNFSRDLRETWNRKRQRQLPSDFELAASEQAVSLLLRMETLELVREALDDSREQLTDLQQSVLEDLLQGESSAVTADKLGKSRAAIYKVRTRALQCIKPVLLSLARERGLQPDDLLL